MTGSASSRVVVFNQTGGPEVLTLTTQALRDPGPGEVRVKINSIGLNRAEVMYRSGQYALKPSFPSRIGCEGAGLVDAIGPGVSRFKVGERVSILQTIDQQVHGVYADHSIVPEAALIASPPEFSDAEAAAFWHALAMAYGTLVMRAGIGPDEIVMVSAATSGVGLATIQVAKAEGATVIAVTRTSAKRQALLAAGADHVIATAKENLVERVTAVTDGKGATVIADSVLGPLLEQLVAAAAPGAKIYLSGLLDGTEIRLPIWPVLLKGIRLEGFIGFLAVEADPTELARFEAYARAKIAQGLLRPIIDRTFQLDQIAEAHRYMEAGKQVGKIVVSTIDA